VKRFIIVGATLALGACASQVGRQFDPALAGRLQPGVSTEADAMALLGAPEAVTTAADGRQMLQWLYVRGAVAGGSSAHLAIIFDGEGRMVRVAHLYQQ
jgi:hypothetical protein